MKNITILTEPDEIHSYMRKLWRTDQFRTSHDQGDLVSHVVDRLAALPRYFYERTDDRLEKGHFTSWWGGIQLRPNDYEKDAVHDLYYLHEIFHAGTMPSQPGLIYNVFLRKLGENEADASVCSEIAAYFALPGLRQLSFNHEIYADRLLKDPNYKLLWDSDPDAFTDAVKSLRRNVMHKDYKPKDTAEQWIHMFSAQNKEAGKLWHNAYDQIETATWNLRLGSLKEGRSAAMTKFMDWLTSPDITKNTAIPFPDEAKAFADVYWRVKKNYEDGIEQKENIPPSKAITPQP